VTAGRKAAAILKKEKFERMPLYEYKCGKCVQVFEVIEKFSDTPLETHATCGGPVERLISTPSFQFKGTGWYVTDYAKKNGNGTSTKSSDTTSKPAEPKTESKPATDSVSKS